MPFSPASSYLDYVARDWYTKGMTSHRDCLHPKTKAARTLCRKHRAQQAELIREMEIEEKAYHAAYIAPFERQEAARLKWEDESKKFCEAHISSADQNAFDTAHEEGFEPYSQRFYECALSTLHCARDNAERVTNPNDPEPGQSIEWKGDYIWVQRVTWGAGRADLIICLDREGNELELRPSDITVY